MKKKLLLALMGLSGSCLFTNIYAENLVQVFQQALSYDPTYQKESGHPVRSLVWKF